VLRVQLLAPSSRGADRGGRCDIAVRAALQAPLRMFASARTVVTQGSTLAFCIGPDECGAVPGRVADGVESAWVLMTTGTDMKGFVQNIGRPNNVWFRAPAVSTARLRSLIRFALED
jgi:hypothetical protein